MDKTKLLLLITFLISSLNSQELDEEYVKSDLKLITWDLEDECTELSATKRRYLLGEGPADKISDEIDHGHLLKASAQKLKKYDAFDVPYDLDRNYTILTKPGDTLLEEGDYSNLITFANKNMDLSRTTKIACENGTENCFLKKQDVLNILSTSRNASTLNTTWSNWQKNLGINKMEYPSILKLVSKAAVLNGAFDAGKYWEMMSDVNDAYEKMNSLWEDIEPLYFKLHDFVKAKLNSRYNSTFENIPVYLLGSNFGDDWSNIADIILPFPQLHHDIQVELGALSVQDSYKLAENFTKSLGFRGLGKHFWTKSNFSWDSCHPQILNFCEEERSEVFTCGKNSFQAHLSAHEVAMEVAMNRRHYRILPLQELRYSAITEALKSVGSLYAFNNLPYYEVLPKDVFSTQNGVENRNTAILLTALKILPKLAYYYAAEKWRLDELENPSADSVRTWWEYRSKYQRVQGVTNQEADFLEDEMILLNKPYVNKFFGLLLQFQLLNYYQIGLFQEDSHIVNSLRDDTNFRELIENYENRNVLDLLTYYYGIDDISAYPLIEFFGNLEDYLENSPVDQATIVPKTPKPKITTKAPPPKKQRKKLAKIVTTTPPIELNDETRSVPIETTTIAGKISVEKTSSSPAAVGNTALMVMCVVMLAAIAGLILWNRSRTKRSRRNRRDEA